MFLFKGTGTAIPNDNPSWLNGETVLEIADCTKINLEHCLNSMFIDYNYWTYLPNHGFGILTEFSYFYCVNVNNCVMSAVPSVVLLSCKEPVINYKGHGKNVYNEKWSKNTKIEPEAAGDERPSPQPVDIKLHFLLTVLTKQNCTTGIRFKISVF